MNSIESNKVWLITGICGMDGSHFADLLFEKGYTNIHGIMRRSATFNTQNIDHIFHKLKLHYGDLTDSMNIFNIISKVKPDYIVNFAAQSHVKVSHDLENYTIQTNTLGILNILQSVRSAGLEKTCRIYQAGTSEEFGNMTDGITLLNENTPKIPVSIYGVSKLAAEHICNIYRDAYNMYVVCSTLFNHEGERRGGIFVTQKISNYVAKYHLNQIKEPLQLGNLNAKRDWGYSKDYMEGVYLMLTQESPKNYILATGRTYSIRQFVELAFNKINIDIEWKGEGKNEIAIDKHTGDILVQVNEKYYRDIDIHNLIGDSTVAQKELNWKPKTDINELVDIMVNSSILSHQN